MDVDALERRRQQNLRSLRGDSRGVTPSIRSFAQAIDRGEVEHVPVLRAARSDLVELARALDEAEVAALAIEVDDPAAELQRFADAALAVSVPVLRTDLILEEFQIWESRAAGADAVLLRADVLEEQLERFAQLVASTHMAPCLATSDTQLVGRFHGAIRVDGDSLLLHERVAAVLDRHIAESSDPAAAFRALLKDA